MQQVFIELWSFRDKWRDLEASARVAYVTQLGPAIQALAEEGVEVLAWGYNDKTIDRRIDYDVFAVYRLPNRAMLDKLQAGIAASGWYDYFEQANAGGAVLSPPAILEDHVLLIT